MNNDDVLASVGPRLRLLREARSLTLAQVATATEISLSTLSRLESGQRRPNLELLLPLARVYAVPLDDLVGAPATGDPRVHLKPFKRGNQTIIPLSRNPGGVQAYKQLISAGSPLTAPDPQVHDGFEWLYVLAGKLRLVLGEYDVVLSAGEVVEFDTRTPHWFGRADENSVEVLSLFSAQGERMHFRTSSKPKASHLG